MFDIHSKYSRSFFIAFLFLAFILVGCFSTKKTDRPKTEKPKTSTVKSFFNKLEGKQDIPPEVAKPVTLTPSTKTGASQYPGSAPVASNLLVKKDANSASPETVLNYSEALGNLTDKFVSLFPSIEGVIVSLKNKGDVFIDLKNEDDIRNATKLKVFRLGKEFKHPLTGEVLGRFEEEIGLIETTEVMESYSKAKVVSEAPGKNIRVGDKVRITSTRIKIAVLPFINKTKEDLDIDMITTEMINSLSHTKRFNIFDNDKFQVGLLEADINYKEFSPERDLRRIKRIVNTDYLLVNSVRNLKGKQVIDSNIFVLKDNSTIYTAKAIVKELPSRAARYAVAGGGYPPVPQKGRSSVNPRFVLQDRSGGFLKPQQGLWKSRVFNEEIRNISIGDVNGDGLKELVVIFKNKVEIYQSSGTKLQKLYTYRDKKSDGFISVDVADINKNGVDEIYISNLRGEFLRSFVIEGKGGRFKKIADKLPLFFRVMRSHSKEPYLVAQPMGQTYLFSKFMYHYSWGGGKLKRNKELGLPITVIRSVYGFILEDIDRDGKLDILQIGDDDRLRLYSLDGKLKWSSREFYGGYSFSFKNPGNTSWTSNPNDPIGTDNMFTIKGRILTYDTDRDGLEEVIIQRNIPTTIGLEMITMGGYADSQMVNLAWDTIGLKEVWRAENVNGVINDFFVGDIDNDKTDELAVVLSVKTGDALDLKENKSMVIVYDLY